MHCFLLKNSFIYIYIKQYEHFRLSCDFVGIWTHSLEQVMIYSIVYTNHFCFYQKWSITTRQIFKLLKNFYILYHLVGHKKSYTIVLHQLCPQWHSQHELPPWTVHYTCMYNRYLTWTLGLPQHIPPIIFSASVNANRIFLVSLAEILGLFWHLFSP